MQPNAQVQRPAVAGLTEANRLFADRFRRGEFAEAALGVYTADARILPPGAPMIRGRDAIVSFWVQAAAALGITDLVLTTVEIEPHGTRILELGRAELTLGGGAQTATGKYLVLWKEEADGWRWDVDIWNMDA